jgi:hypothetical protein
MKLLALGTGRHLPSRWFLVQTQSIQEYSAAKIIRSIEKFNQIQAHYDPGIHPATDRNEYQESSWEVKRDRRVRVTKSPRSVIGLSRQCGYLDVSLPYEAPLPVSGPLLFLPSSSSIVLTRLSGPRSRPTTSQKIWALGIEPGPLDL